MPNMTLAIPDELKARMDRYREINWSEVARQAIDQRVLMMDKLNTLLSKSQLTDADIDKHSTHIKKSVYRKYGRPKGS